MRETWLVTGASGFLGSNAGLWLGDAVHRVGQSRTVPTPGAYDEMIGVDLRDLDAVRAMVETTRPQVILHTAAVSGHATCADVPEQAWAVNVDATRALAQAAADIGARLVYISTDAVFSGSRGHYTEDDEPEPFSLYGETKLAGEIAVQEVGGPHLIARTNFFGWSISGRRSVLEFFVNALRRGEPVKGYPDVITTSMYVGHLLDAIWNLTRSEVDGLVHVASADAISKHDFGVAAAEVFGLDTSLISPEAAPTGTPGVFRSRDISLDTTYLTSLLGHRPPTQVEGLIAARREEPTHGAELRAMDVES